MMEKSWSSEKMNPIGVVESTGRLEQEVNEDDESKIENIQPGDYG